MGTPQALCVPDLSRRPCTLFPSEALLDPSAGSACHPPQQSPLPPSAPRACPGDLGKKQKCWTDFKEKLPRPDT